MKHLRIAAVLLSFAVPCAAFARSGCCSSHGGVVGCGCGDGTPLSATCAPYYPQCSKPKPVTKPAPVVTNNCAKNLACPKGKKPSCINNKAKCI